MDLVLEHLPLIHTLTLSHLGHLTGHDGDSGHGCQRTWVPAGEHTAGPRHTLTLTLSRFSHVRLFATPWTVACQALLSMEISRQEYWEQVAVPSFRGPSQPRDRTRSPALQADSLLLSHQGRPPCPPTHAWYPTRAHKRVSC